MYIEPLSTLTRRLDSLILSLADRYMVPYSLINTRCKLFINALLDCWIRYLDYTECRLEMKLLEECVEELSGDLGW